METTKNIILILMITSILISTTALYLTIKNIKKRTSFNLFFLGVIIAAIIAGLNFSLNTISDNILGIIWLINSLLSAYSCYKTQEIIDLEEEYILLKETELDLIKKVFEENYIYYDESKEELIIEPKKPFEKIIEITKEKNYKLN